MSDEQAAASYVRQTIDKWGRLDVSVQCAGISPVTGPVTEMDVAAFDTVIRVNLRGGESCRTAHLSRVAHRSTRFFRVRAVFLGLQQSLKAMLASPSQGQGCSVVLISSQLGLDGTS